MFCETKPQLAVRNVPVVEYGHNNTLSSERKHHAGAVPEDPLIISCFKASVGKKKQKKKNNWPALFQNTSLTGYRYLCLDEIVSVPNCTEPVQPVQTVLSLTIRIAVVEGGLFDIDFTSYI